MTSTYLDRLAAIILSLSIVTTVAFFLEGGKTVSCSNPVWLEEADMVNNMDTAEYYCCALLS